MCKIEEAPYLKIKLFELGEILQNLHRAAKIDNRVLEQGKHAKVLERGKRRDGALGKERNMNEMNERH